MMKQLKKLNQIESLVHTHNLLTVRAVGQENSDKEYLERAEIQDTRKVKEMSRSHPRQSFLNVHFEK